MRWYFPQISAPFRGGWRSANRQFLSLLPVRVIDFNNATDVAVHRRLVALVDSMNTLQSTTCRRGSAAQTRIVKQQIDTTDAEIDRLVYGLYGLTREEIAIVEGKSQ